MVGTYFIKFQGIFTFCQSRKTLPLSNIRLFMFSTSVLFTHTGIQRLICFSTNTLTQVKIPTVAERLQYFRNKKSLLQKDVAKAVGIDRSTYISYENPAHKNYPLNVLEKIADLYDVNITALLDDYNRFLYDGQANQIQSTRKSLGLTQYHFGELYGVSARTVRGWEKDRIQISKKVWKRIYKQEMAAL